MLHQNRIFGYRRSISRIVYKFTINFIKPIERMTSSIYHIKWCCIRIIYYTYIFLMKRKLKDKKTKLANPLPKYPRGICKHDDIQLRRRSPHLQEVGISCTKFSQPDSTFVPFSQSMTKWDHPRKRRKLPNERKQSCMRMKILLFSINNKIQSYLRVRFHDDKSITKIPRQLKTLPNSWKFSKQISRSSTRSRKTMNPIPPIVSQKTSKTCITRITKRRFIHIDFNKVFWWRILTHLTGHMAFICWANNMNHGRMIGYYIIYWLPSSFPNILKNLFISIPPNFIAGYYEPSTCLSNNMTFEPKLTILYVEVVRKSRTKVPPNIICHRTVTKSMHINFNKCTTPMTRSIRGKMSWTTKGISREASMHHQPAKMS